MRFVFCVLLTVVVCTRVLPVAEIRGPVVVEEGQVHAWSGDLANLSSQNGSQVFLIARVRRQVFENREIPIVHPHGWASLLSLCGLILLILFLAKQL